MNRFYLRIKLAFIEIEKLKYWNEWLHVACEIIHRFLVLDKKYFVFQD